MSDDIRQLARETALKILSAPSPSMYVGIFNSLHATIRGQARAVIEREVEAALFQQLNEQTRLVDEERRRWYAALSALGDLEGLAPEVVGARAREAQERSREALRTTRSNILSLGPAGALGDAYRGWLRVVDVALDGDLE